MLSPCAPHGRSYVCLRRFLGFKASKEDTYPITKRIDIQMIAATPVRFCDLHPSPAGFAGKHIQMEQFDLDLTNSADEAPVFGHRAAFRDGILNLRISDHSGTTELWTVWATTGATALHCGALAETGRVENPNLPLVVLSSRP
jgi:hypothetical protein